MAHSYLFIPMRNFFFLGSYYQRYLTMGLFSSYECWKLYGMTFSVISRTLRDRFPTLTLSSSQDSRAVANAFHTNATTGFIWLLLFFLSLYPVFWLTSIFILHTLKIIIFFRWRQVVNKKWLSNLNCL